jgi:hypothetical protein
MSCRSPSVDWGRLVPSRKTPIRCTRSRTGETVQHLRRAQREQHSAFTSIGGINEEDWSKLLRLWLENYTFLTLELSIHKTPMFTRFDVTDLVRVAVAASR